MSYYLREEKAATVIAIMETLLQAKDWVPAGEFHTAVLGRAGLVEEVADVIRLAMALTRAGIISSSTPGSWDASTKFRLENGWIQR